MPESAAIEFLNTKRGGKRGAADAVDSLRSFDDLAAWCVRAGLLARRYAGGPSESKAVKVAAFAQALSLRAALETFLASRTDASRHVLAGRLNEALREPLTITEVVGAAGTIVAIRAYRTRTATNVPFAIATEILAFLEATKLETVKRCEAEDCIWFFIDETKNGSRRWCTSELCGARHRARKHYRKSKTVGDERRKEPHG
jgi:predicted RNA-binding Zn ribbon-like protein